LTTSDQEDIIDETLAYFKANVLFRNFEINGPADLMLAYLILYTTQCLVTIRGKNKSQAVKDLYTLSVSNFLIPGDGGFALGGLVAAPASRADGGTPTSRFLFLTI
jgi:actin related protein 2/3 complex subunit 3